MIDLEAVLRFAVGQGCSDIHLKAGSAPRVRVDGHLTETSFPVATPADLEVLVAQVLPKDRSEEFVATNEADFALDVDGLGRFRCNAFRQRGAAGMVLRAVATSIPDIASLGLPPVVGRLASEPRGLVLVTGPTGSGKTSTLASMIDLINTTQAVNIVTIEDPIEVVHQDKRSIVNQREIGADTRDYAQAMRRVLRQDPDVILIGEIRDSETTSAALSAAETGHMVFSTLHTVNAAETINRIVDFFPPYQQHQTRLMLSTLLRGVISQRLVDRADGRGRVPAVEIMVNTGRIADRIADPDGGQGETIEDLIGDGEWYGMQTFDQSLLNLCRSGTITRPDAMSAASNPHDFLLALRRAGLVDAA